MFFDQISVEDIVFFILYGITGVVPLIAAVYLLLRRGNAIAPGVTPPVRLRRWTAAFFAVTTLAHVWWLLFSIYSGDLHSVAYMVLAMLDCVLLFITFAGMLLAMLQDRRRPVQPALVALMPFVVLWGAFMAYPSSLLEYIAAGYLVLLGLLFTGYMVVAVRQYGRWLNDNYADLENKKVWLSQTVSLVSMLMFVIYVLAADIVLIWFIHIIELVIVGLLLWRVDTLPSLTSDLSQIGERLRAGDGTSGMASEYAQGLKQADEQSVLSRMAVPIDLDQIELLLKEHCVDTQLYLQHDLSLVQLAHTIGTNRFYLSQYFSRQGITYNTYINNLRINHFIRLYQETITAGETNVTAQELASECGYRSYSTFILAFKQRTGQTVSAWMRR